MNVNIICQTQLLSILSGDSPSNLYTVFEDFNLVPSGINLADLLASSEEPLEEEEN
jgi:hypothetical protein